MSYTSYTATVAKLEYQNSSSWTEVTYLLNLEAPPGDVDKLKSTTLASTAHEYLPGLLDPGELSGECIYSKEAYESFDDLRGNMKNWKITFRDALVVTFAGFVSSIMAKLDPEELETIQFKIQVSGGIGVS